MEKFYKTGKVAKLLGITNRTLNRLAKSGILIPAQVTDKGYNLYSAEQILEYQTRDIENRDIENRDIDTQNRDIENRDIENRDIENRDIFIKNSSNSRHSL